MTLNRGEGTAGIAVDAAGHAYVTGSTGSGDFPLTVADASRAIPGANAWVVELSADGAQLLYANQRSATGAPNSYTSASGIAIDTSGNAYVSGVTSDAGGAGFVAMLPPDGSAFDVFPLAGVSQLGSTGIALDSSGAAYVAGTAGSGFPATDNSFQPWYSGGGDAFIAKVIFDTNAKTR